MTANICYWTPTTNEFYEGLPCLACYSQMNSNEESCSPQQINTCGHVVCYNCVHMAHLSQEVPFCPVLDCIKPMIPDELPSFANAEANTDAKVIEQTEEISESGYMCDVCNMCNMCNVCGKTDCDNESHLQYESGYVCDMCYRPNCYDDCEYYKRGCNGAKSKKHWCGWEECNGDCGVLWCGCIDICRIRSHWGE